MSDRGYSFDDVEKITAACKLKHVWENCEAMYFDFNSEEIASPEENIRAYMLAGVCADELYNLWKSRRDEQLPKARRIADEIHRRHMEDELVIDRREMVPA